MVTTFNADFTPGIKNLAKLVQVTYGPRGRTVAVDRGRRGILATTDGMTVAGEFQPAPALDALAVSVLRNAAYKVGTEVGDGTSTTVLLASAFYLEAQKLVAAGEPASDIAQDLQALAQSSMADLEWLPHVPATRELLEAVAVQSTKADKAVASAIAEACLLTGKYGLISVEDGKSRGVELEQKQGLELDRGWESSDFGWEWEREVCLVALVAGEITDTAQITPVLEAASTVGPGDLPLVVVAFATRGEALQTMVYNAKKEVLDSCAVRCPGSVPLKMRPLLEDLAALTQGEVFDPQVQDFEQFQTHYLGSLQSIKVGAKKSTLTAFEDAYDGIEKRIATLVAEQEQTVSTHNQEKLQARIAGLSEGVCVLRVGGVSELEIRERRSRIEDGLSAVRAAHQEGLVPGAGMAFWRLAQRVSDRDFSPAQKVFAEGLCRPLRALVENAGYEPALIEQGLSGEPWEGFDVLSGEFRDLRCEEPLLDPLAVFKGSVLAAASVAATLLMCNTAITKPR